MKIFKYIFSNIKESMSRFVIPFYGSILIFILSVLQTVFEFSDETVLKVILSLVFAIILSVACEFMSIRYDFSKKADLIQSIACAAVTIPCFFLINDLTSDSYVFLAWAGLIVVFMIAAIYFMYDTQENREMVLPQILKSGIFSGLVAALFFAGIAICLLAVNFLIVELPSGEKWYLITAYFAFMLLFFNMFIALLPRKGQAVTLPKIFKVLVMYVAFPIYGLLLAVLYAYLTKILVTWDMPGGQINLFASLASLFYIFFYLTLGSYDNKFVNFFMKFGGYFMIPILFAQGIAVWIRFDAYGLTVARWISIIFNLIATAFIVVSLIKKGKHIKYVILAFAVICLLSSVGPLNAIDIPIYEQTIRLERVLKRNDMFADGKIIPNGKISEEDKRAITSAYEEIIYEDKAPVYLDEGLSFYDIFGFERIDEYGIEDESRHTYMNKSALHDDVDIEGYVKYFIIDVYSNDTFEIVIDDVVYDVEEQILAIVSDSDDSDMIFKVADDVVIYLSYVSFETDEDAKLMYFSATGFALVK
jgi:hypothetical protein